MKKYILILLCTALPAFAEEAVVMQELPLEEPKQIVDEPKQELPTKEATVDTPKANNLDDLYTLIDSQNSVIQDLTNRLEQAEFQITQLNQRIDKINQDVDFRLKELETKPVVQESQPVIIDKTSDKERYDYAYEYIKKGNYPEAQKLFTDFTKDFPKSKLYPNALYWLGETYYTQGQYETAVGFFADVFSKHKDSTKAPDALFKMGLSMKGLKKNDAACSAWKGLLSEYPKIDATLKKRTQEEMKKLKCSS